MSKFNKPVIPGEPNDLGRDPESREVMENPVILVLAPTPAGDDALRHVLPKGMGAMESWDSLLSEIFL